MTDQHPQSPLCSSSTISNAWRDQPTALTETGEMYMHRGDSRHDRAICPVTIAAMVFLLANHNSYPVVYRPLIYLTSDVCRCGRGLHLVSIYSSHNASSLHPTIASVPGGKIPRYLVTSADLGSPRIRANSYLIPPEH